LKGADLAANSLGSLGIKYVFGMSGSSISGILDSIYQSDSDVEFIGIRHENAAAFMADAYSRVTHLPSACAFQWGPGAANSMLGVATAYRDNSPIMIITGETPTDRVGREGFHEWNQVGVFSNVTKWSHTPRSPKEIPWTFKTAYSRAIGGNPGPVLINLPGDVLSKELEGTEQKISPISRETFRTRPNPDLVRKALEVILSSRQPVIIVGSGVIWSAASAELQEFAELLSIPVVNSLSARGAIPEDHPLSLGVLWAAVGRTTSKAAVNAIKSTDCLISIGCRLSDVTTNGWSLVPRSAKIIQVHNNPNQIGFQYDVTVGMQADPKLFLNDMILELKNEMARVKSVTALWKGSTRLSDLASDRKSFFEFLDSVKGTNQVNPWSIIKSLNKLLKRKSIITTGAGTHSWFVGMLPRYLPGTGMKAAGFGTVGFPFPASMGAKLAAPDFQVVSCDGDGGFMATMPDLETAVRHDIGITEVIFNDRSLGAERWKSKFQYGERYYEVDIKAPDYAKVAQNFGARGYRVEKDEELDSVLTEAFSGKGPAVVDVIVDPWVSPGIFRLGADLPVSSSD